MKWNTIAEHSVLVIGYPHAEKPVWPYALSALRVNRASSPSLIVKHPSSQPAQEESTP